MELKKEELSETELVYARGTKKITVKLGKKYWATAEEYHGFPSEKGVLTCTSIYKYPDGFIEINMEMDYDSKLSPGPVQFLKKLEEL